MLERDEPISPLEPSSSQTPVPAGQSFFQSVPWRLSDLLIGLAPLVAIRLSGAIIDRSQLPESIRWITIPLSVGTTAWLLLYPLLVARRRSANRPQFPRPRKLLIEALIALPTLLVLWLLLGIVLLVWTKLAGQRLLPDNPLERLARGQQLTTLAFALVWAVFAAPATEETFFRGMLFNGLRLRIHPLFAALLQAAAFGLLHTFGFAHSAAVGLMGLLLAGVYAWRKTLVAPIYLHTLQNAAAAAVAVSTAIAVANAPWLGVNGIPGEGKCRLVEVYPSAAAAEAGLQVNDVVTAIDGQSVTDFNDLARIIGAKRAGDRVAIEFLRDGEPHRAEAVLKRRSD